MVERVLYNKFNRGEVDSKALVRGDVEKIRNSASLMKNWLPERLGSMTYRPGTEYLGELSSASYMVPFIAATDDTALLQFSDDSLAVWIDDAPISYSAVSATVTNGDFTAGLTGWTDASTGIYPVDYQTAEYAIMFSDTFSPQILRQSVAITETTSEHCLKIETVHGRVTLCLGTSSGSCDITETELLPGTHYIAFTPNTSTLYIEFRTQRTETVWIDSCQFYSGALAIPTGISAANLSSIRYSQSADVLFVTSANNRIKRVSRRSTRSWSVEDFLFFDGPYRSINDTGITLKKLNSISAVGFDPNIEVEASAPLFNSGHVGALFRIPIRYPVTYRTLHTQDSFTPGMKVYGSGSASRTIDVSVTGTWTGKVILQRSYTGGDSDDEWAEVTSYTSPIITTFNDTLANVTVYYRLYVASITSGSIKLLLSNNTAHNNTYSDLRVIEYVSPTQVVMSFVNDDWHGMPGPTQEAVDWYESEWSDYRGWPTAVELHEGRLWFAGRDKIWASQSDVFDGFDTFAEGDSASIQKAIGFGPVNNIEWAKSVNRLLLGTASDEISARSNSFGEVLTPSNVNLKSDSTQGSDSKDAVKVDQYLYFVQRSQTRIYELGYAGANDAQVGIDITTLNPSICDAGITRIAVTRQPETRVYVVLDDGTARVFMADKAEDVASWTRLETDGTYDDVVVLPGVEEDRVYFVVTRNGQINLEKQALQSECIGASVSKHFDSFVSYTSPGTVLTGLEHLEGKYVAVWADGAVIDDGVVESGGIVVASGSATIPSGKTDVVVGLPYTATYGSNKLREHIGAVTSNLNKRVNRIALIMENVLPSAIRYGDTETPTQKLAFVEGGKTFDQDVVQTDYEYLPLEFDGLYDVDARVYVTATGPATVLSLMVEVDEPNYTPPQQA